MRKYPAVAESLPEDKAPYRFINNIRQKRAHQQNPYVYIACQVSKPRQPPHGEEPRLFYSTSQQRGRTECDSSMSE